MTTKFIQTIEAPESKVNGSYEAKKTSAPLSENLTRYQQETAQKAQSAKAQADAFNASNTKPTSSTSSFSFTDPSTWSSKSSSPTTSRTSSVDSTGSFDMNTDTNKSTSNKNSSNTAEKSTDQTNRSDTSSTGKTSNMTNEAKSFAEMAKQLKEQSQNVKKTSETGPMVDEMDPTKKLSPGQRSQAMEKSQSWISPYDGSKFQEWVESVMNLVDGKGYKTDAQIESEAQAKKTAEDKRIQDMKAQQNKIATLDKQISDLQSKIDKFDNSNKNAILFTTPDTPEITQARNDLKSKTQAKAQAQNDFVNLLNPDELKQYVKDNSHQTKQQKTQDAQDQAFQTKHADILNSVSKNAVGTYDTSAARSSTPTSRSTSRSSSPTSTGKASDLNNSSQEFSSNATTLLEQQKAKNKNASALNAYGRGCRKFCVNGIK